MVNLLYIAIFSDQEMDVFIKTVQLLYKLLS